MRVFKYPEHTVLPPNERILVSGIGAGQNSRRQVQDSQPHGDKHLGLVVFADLGIHRVQDLTRAAALLCTIVDEDFCRHHEQCRRDSLI